MCTTATSGAATVQSAPLAKLFPKRKLPRMTPEQSDLAGRYVPLARLLARPFKDAWPTETADYDSAALLALVEAAIKFDPLRNVQFATYARFRVLGALRDVRRKFAKEGYPRELPNVPRAFHYIPGPYERGLLMMTSPETPVDEVVASIEQVEHWLNTLPARHARACREIYLNYRSQEQLAAEFGCAKSRISNLHAQAMDILRDSPSVREAAVELGFDINRN